MLRAWLLVLSVLVLPLEAHAANWGWMGVRIRDLSEQETEEISLRHGIGEGFGALIVEVLRDTPAARSGLKNGDLVVAFRDQPVVDTRTLQRFVAATPTGEEVWLTVLRGGEGRRRLRVRLASMPPDVMAERVAAEFGFLVQDGPASPEGGAGLSGAPRVVTVLRGGRAEQGGLRVGDLIVKVNGRPVLSRQAVREALAAAAVDQPLRLAVERGGERFALTLAPASGRIP